MDEFIKLYTGLHMDEATNHGIMSKTYVSKDQDIPSSWDWRSHGYVTGVKDQVYTSCAVDVMIIIIFIGSMWVMLGFWSYRSTRRPIFQSNKQIDTIV